jgi:NAD(P)-dependent dehydrogenase (short-subunit alcohol dehydrogenase family)
MGEMVGNDAQAQSRSGQLVGKVAPITGAARGIGRVVAELFAANGAAVVMFDIADPAAVVPPMEGYRPANQEDFDEAFASVRAINPDVLQVRGDVRSLDDLEGAVAQAVSTFGGLDIAVANAAYIRWHRFEDGTELDWRTLLDINVYGVFVTFKAAIPALRRRGGGRLIAMGSVAGRQGVAGNGAYTATKWAVLGLTKQAALELGSDNITANVVSAGPVETPMFYSDAQRAIMGVSSREEQDAVFKLRIPLGETAAVKPVDVAAAALYLAGEAGHSISGACIDVDNGYSASNSA